MSRDWDGVDDNIVCASHASIDDYVQKSVLFWSNRDNVALPIPMLCKGSLQGLLQVSDAGWVFFARDNAPLASSIAFSQDFSVTAGAWRGPTTLDPGVDYAVGFSYDRSSVNNDPTLYIDGASVAVTETNAPVGAVEVDAGLDLFIGTEDGQSFNFAGTLSWIVYDSTLFTAADANRHRWWGMAPGGPSTADVWHPLWTDEGVSIKNKGTATADGNFGAFTPAQVSTPARVERMWGGTMGVGR